MGATRLGSTLTCFALALAGGCLAPGHAVAQPRSATALAGHLLLTGSSTMAPLMSDIARRFTARHPGVTVEVQSGGTGRGIADARAGAAHIGMASRALGDKEKDLRGYPVGRDGIALIVNRANPITTLSQQQLRAVLTGKTTGWKAAGGRDAPIVVIGRSPGRASTEVIVHFLKIAEEELRPQHVRGDNPDLIAAVAADPNAIGFVSVGAVERAVSSGVAIRPLRAGDVEASVRNILSGDYPIARPLTLVTHQAPQGTTRAFIDYALSPAVADLVRKHEFIPYED